MPSSAFSGNAIKTSAFIASVWLQLENILLAALHWVLFRRRFSVVREPLSRILIFRVAALGDFILTVPSLVQIRNKFPSAKITLLTISTSDSDHRNRVSKYSNGMSASWLSLVCPSLVDETIELYSLNLYTLYRDVRPRIRTFGPEATFLLSDIGTSMSGLIKKLLFLSWVGVRSPVFGWRTLANYSLLRKAQYEAGLFLHHIFGPIQAVNDCHYGIITDPQDIRFPIDVSPDDTNWARTHFGSTGAEGIFLIALVPGSLRPHKRWPIENFILLAQKLLSYTNAKVVILGTAEDIPLASQLSTALGNRAFNIAGQTTIGEAAALFKLCRLVVGNDGGALHLASAVGCPTVAIMPGIQYPGSIEPWNDRHRAVRHPVKCSPCYNFIRCPLGHSDCMNLLPVESVYARCIEVIGGATEPLEAHTRDTSAFVWQ